MLWEVLELHSFFMVELYPIAWIEHILLIHSSVGGYFHFMAIVNYAAWIIHRQVFVWTPIFYARGHRLRCRIFGSYGKSLFNFLRSYQVVFHRFCTTLYSHWQCMRFLISPHPCQPFYFMFVCFYYSHPHCGFDSHFPNDQRCWTSFYVLIGHFHLLWRSIYSSSLYFNWIVYLLLLSCNILDTRIEPNTWFSHIVSHSVGYLFTLLIVSFDEQNLNFDEVQFIIFFLACAFNVISMNWSKSYSLIQGQGIMSHLQTGDTENLHGRDHGLGWSEELGPWKQFFSHCDWFRLILMGPPRALPPKQSPGSLSKGRKKGGLGGSGGNRRLWEPNLMCRKLSSLLATSTWDDGGCVRCLSERRRGLSRKETAKKAMSLTRIPSRELWLPTALSSAHPGQLRFSSNRSPTWLESCAETGGKTQIPASVDNHDAGVGISLFCCSFSGTVRTCHVQNSLPASSSNARTLLLLKVGPPQCSVWLPSTQESKSSTAFPHFLSSFAFQKPRYDFIFKMKFCRSLAHND